MPQNLPRSSAGRARLRVVAGRVLVACWWACAVPVGATGLAVGLLTPGRWLVSVCVLSALLGAMAATGIAGWRDEPLTTAPVLRAFAAWALGFVTLVGLSRLLESGTGTVVGALLLTGLPLTLPAVRRCLGDARTDTTPAVQARRALGIDVRRADLGVLRGQWQTTDECVRRASDPYEVGLLADVRTRCLDEIERRDPPGFTDWLHADERWLDLISPTPTTDRPPGDPGS